MGRLTMSPAHQSLVQLAASTSQSVLVYLARVLRSEHMGTPMPEETKTFFSFYRPGAMVLSLILLVLVRVLDECHEARSC